MERVEGMLHPRVPPVLRRKGEEGVRVEIEGLTFMGGRGEEKGEDEVMGDGEVEEEEEEEEEKMEEEVEKVVVPALPVGSFGFASAAPVIVVAPIEPAVIEQETATSSAVQNSEEAAVEEDVVLADDLADVIPAMVAVPARERKVEVEVRELVPIVGGEEEEEEEGMPEIDMGESDEE